MAVGYHWGHGDVLVVSENGTGMRLARHMVDRILINLEKNRDLYSDRFYRRQVEKYEQARAMYRMGPGGRGV